MYSPRLAIAAFLSLAVIASAAVAQEGSKLRYQFKEGQDLQYVAEQKMKMTMTVAGMEIETKMGMTLQFSWKVLGVDKNGNAQLRLRVTHAKMTMEGVPGNFQVDSNDPNEPEDNIAKIMHQIIKATGSMELTGTILPTGEVKDGKVSEATLKALKNIQGAEAIGPDSFKSMINSVVVVLSTDAVKKGKTWTHKTDMKSTFGKTNTESTYTYEGVVERNKVKLDKISVKPKITIEANPDAPAKIEVKAAKGVGTVLFDNKLGYVVETSMQQTTQMSVTTNGMEIEQTIEQTTILRLKKE